MDLGELVEVREASGIGGNRGVFAKRDIRPGEVIIEDRPLLATLADGSHEGEPVHVQLARRILQSEKREELLSQIEPLYPQKLSDIKLAMLDKAYQKHGKTVTMLASLQREPKLQEADVLCILLKVCFSAFCGGLYVKKAMLNHCCRPNCVAFQPGERTSGTGSTISTEASEVVATQHIAKDAEVRPLPRISLMHIASSVHAPSPRCFFREACSMRASEASPPADRGWLCEHGHRHPEELTQLGLEGRCCSR